MHLKTAILHFLDSLPSSSYFFPCNNLNCSIIGSVRGQLVCILVVESERRLTKSQINFSAKLYRSMGEHYVMYSLEDATEIAKERGWFDD